MAEMLSPPQPGEPNVPDKDKEESTTSIQANFERYREPDVVTSVGRPELPSSLKHPLAIPLTDEDLIRSLFGSSISTNPAPIAGATLATSPIRSKSTSTYCPDKLLNKSRLEVSIRRAVQLRASTDDKSPVAEPVAERVPEPQWYVTFEWSPLFSIERPAAKNVRIRHFSLLRIY